MIVQMVLIAKPGYSTRALKPFPVSESWALRLEMAQKARRLTAEELAEIEASKGKPIELPAEQPVARGRRGRPPKQAEA